MTTHSGQQGEPAEPSPSNPPYEGVVLPPDGEPVVPDGAGPGAQPSAGQPWGQPWGPEPGGGPMPPHGADPRGPYQGPEPGQYQELGQYQEPGQGGRYQEPEQGPYPPQQSSLRQPPPDGGESTQYLPPVPDAVPGTGQYPGQHPGAGAPSSPGAADEATQVFGPPLGQGQGGDAESTARLRSPLPPEAVQQSSGDAEATQMLPPQQSGGGAAGHPAGPHAEAPPGPTPYGIRPGTPQERQPPEGFENLFRSDSAAPARDAAQQPPPYAATGAPAGPTSRGRAGAAGRSRRLSGPALAGIVIAGCAVVGLILGAAMTGGGEEDGPQAGPAESASPDGGESGQPPAGAGGAEAQAKQLSRLLGDSNASRSAVIRSVENIKKCDELGRAARELRQAAQQRNNLVDRLKQLTLDTLPQYQELTEALTTAWQASAEADRHYAAWADEVAGEGCSGGSAPTTDRLSEANAASGEATEAKEQAAGLWNPTARKYGLPERKVTQL